ncbi:MAG: ABC transporter permease [Gemmatimonadales bacterium]
MSVRRTPVWVLGLTGLVYLFLHVPVIVLMVFSFNASRFGVGWTGFTLEWYRRLFAREDILQGLGRSLLVGLLTALLATAFGTLLALALGRRRFRGRRAVEALLVLPIVTPEIVVGISLLLLFALLGVPLGLGTITIAHVAFSVAFVAVVVRARLEGMDTSLEEAALMLGADEPAAFRTVTLPLLLPGIAAGALLAFTLSFDDYVITSFVAGTGSSTLPMVVYSMVRRNIEPTINAISTIVVAGTALLLVLADRLRRSA